MPEIHTDAVATVILLAREIEESVQVGAHDGVRDREAGQQAKRRLRGFIAELTDEERLSLVAIAWIGRDTFSAEEYDVAYETAREEANTPTEDYLIGMPMLAEYLESGLESLGISPGDAEEDLY